jgi:hypothetical protein
MSILSNDILFSIIVSLVLLIGSLIDVGMIEVSPTLQNFYNATILFHQVVNS